MVSPSLSVGLIGQEFNDWSLWATVDVSRSLKGQGIKLPPKHADRKDCIK